MKMVRWRVLLLVAILPLAGCFQQAGDALQSTGSTAAPIPTGEPTDTQLQVDTEASPTVVIIQQNGPTTATLPPITIIVQPTLDAGANSLDETPDAATPDPNAQPSTFITPGISLRPDVETQIPSALGGNPTATPSGLITPTSLFSSSTDNVSSECIYTVQPGDNLFRIAVSHDTSVDEMRSVNPELSGTNPIIQPGQALVLPNCDETGAGMVEVEEDTALPEVPSIITPAGGPASSGSDSTAGSQVYVVKAGDTLFTIAQRYGITVAEIVAANELLNPDRLSLGQELFIPQDGNG